MLRWLGVDRNNGLLVLANLLWGIGSGLYAAIWPVHIQRLGAAPAEVGLALAITTAVSTVIYIPAAGLAGRVGRKPAMLAGWLMGPLSSLVFAFAGHWEQLLPGIVLLALVALCAPAYLSYIALAAGGRDLPRIYSLMSAAAAAGTAAASPIGGVLADQIPMAWIFLAVGFWYALSAACLLPLDDLDATGSVQAAGRAGGTGQAGRQRERVTFRGTLRAYAAVLQNGQLARLMAVQLALLACANLAQPLAANWLVFAYDYSLTEIGTLGAVASLASVGWGVLLGRLATRYGARTGLLVSTLAVASGAGLLLAAWSLPVGVAAFTLRGAFAALRSLSTGTTAASLRSASASASIDSGLGSRPSPERPGHLERGFAVYNTALTLTLTVSTVLAGQLYQIHPATPAIASGLGAIPFALALYATALPSRVLRAFPRPRRFS